RRTKRAMIQAADQTDSGRKLSDASRAWLDELLLTAAPSGNEQAIQHLIRQRMSDVAQTCQTDMLGNLILGVHTEKPLRVMLAGHCDQIGYIVKYISPGGYLYLDSIGGNDYAAAIAETVTIHTRQG